MIRCLSLWQPWASLIFAPDEWRKRVETRSWRTTYRGWLVIHAAKAWGAEQKEPIKNCERLQMAFANAQLDRSFPDWPPLGAYLGIVRLDHVQPTDRFAPSELERALGNYAPGRYAWLLRDAIAFPEPIPGRGGQRVFGLPMNQYETIWRAVRAAAAANGMAIDG